MKGYKYSSEEERREAKRASSRKHYRKLREDPVKTEQMRQRYRDYYNKDVEKSREKQNEYLRKRRETDPEYVEKHKAYKREYYHRRMQDEEYREKQRIYARELYRNHHK